jgi:hypothetical protein
LEEVLNDSDYEMEHILGKRKLVVHTDRISDELSDSISTLLESESPKNIKVERYNHTFEISWREINKYAECTDASELYAVDPDKHGSELHLGVTNWYTLDLTSDGNFIYPLPKLKKLAAGWGSSYFQKVTAEEFKISLPSLTGNVDRLFQTCKSKVIECDLPLVAGFTAGYCEYLRRFAGNTPNVSFWDYTFVACGWRHNEMLDIDCDFSKATTATDMASNSCKLNKASVLRICVGEKSIPAYTSGTHKITLGIHVDLQNDEEVLDAIANAESKGWTITIQWNGTSTKDESLSSEIINKLELTSIQLPENYTRLMYLESDGNGQNINTNYVPTNNTGISVIAKQITSFDGVPLGCGNMTDARIFAPRVTLINNDWSYGWSSFVHGGNTTTNAKGRIYEGQLNYLNSKIASIYLNDGTYKENTLTDLSFTPTSPIHLFGYYSNTNNSINSIWKGRIYRVTITENESIVKDFIPCLDQNNVPCMYDIVNEVAYYNIKEGTSFGYEDSKEEMYIITTTYGMRGRYFQPVIYAKLSEIERPDGSKEQILNWGHYVTNPEDYQEFSSLEEAKEYFGISEES